MSGNVDRVRRAHQAFNDRDFDASVGAVVGDSTVVVDHGRGASVTGPAEFRGWLEGFTSMSSDIELVDAVYIDAGDHVTAQFRAVGTQDGPLDPFPASGNPYTLDVCEVWRFAGDGPAVEGHNYSDGLGLLIQLGHIQPPG